MSSKSYIYHAEAQLNDGTFELLDLEEHGWADKERLAKVVRWSLIPKAEAFPAMGGRNWPVVIVDIPEGARPVFKTRAFNKVRFNAGTEGTFSEGPLFRCYAIGWKLKTEERLVWVLPTGDIEFGEDPTLADAILKNWVA